MREQPSATLIPSPQFRQLVQRLEQLHATPEHERWPGGEFPDDVAFRDAGAFVNRLPFPLAALPHISLADDGEVNFAWDDGLHIDLGFYGTGTFSYYARSADGREHFGDDVPADSALPPVLESLLRA